MWGWVQKESGPIFPASPSGRGTPLSAATNPPLAAGSAASTPAAARSVPGWYRTDHPGAFDARGRADHEIQTTLQNAWDLGHDAVLLRNYTAPNGRVGDVLVVKDPAQLRSPSARFNPAQRDSRNLLAGIAGAVAYPLWADPSQE